MEVAHTTIGRWLMNHNQDINVQMHNLHQPSPITRPDPELDRLKERGWTQERIAGVMEVARTTVLNWLRNVKIDNPNQPSLKQPDPELIRLQKELAARDEFERQQSKTEGSEHFGNSEVRWVDKLLYLYTHQFDIVVDSFARLSHSIKYLRAASGTF
jgi:transcriptional regulator with XRE-family HTH domain